MQPIIALILTTLFFAVFAVWVRVRSCSEISGRISTYSTIPVESTLMDFAGQYPYFSFSPDGRTIAYSSDRGLQLKSLSDFSIKILEGTEKATLVTFSPNGQSLAFEMEGHIYKIGIDGSPKSLIYSLGAGTGMSWGKDGYIYYSPGFGQDGIWRISSNGGVPEQITKVIDSLGEHAHRWAELLPDTKTLLFTALGPSTGSIDSKILIKQLYSGERKILVEKAIFGRYLSNGNLLFANNEGNIFILPFDLRKLKTKGEAKAVISGVNTANAGGAVFISASETGNLIFIPRNTELLNVIRIVDRSGKLIEKDTIPCTALERIGYGWSSLDIAPSGRQLAITGRSFGSSDIWILDLITYDAERITFESSEDEVPVWSPDGKAVAYTSAMTGNNRRLFIKDLSDASKPRLIRSWPRHIHFSDWSKDGKWIAAYDFTSTNGTDCYAISVNSSDSVIIAASHANEANATFSPDGKWIAFQSDESGHPEIYIVSFPDITSKRQISINGGTLPNWDKSGKYIYYLSDDFLISHSVETSSDFKRGIPVKLFTVNFSNYAISPDGLKFFLIRRNTKRTNPPLCLITNWFQELDKKTD